MLDALDFDLDFDVDLPPTVRVPEPPPTVRRLSVCPENVDLGRRDSSPGIEAELPWLSAADLIEDPGQ